MMEFLSNHIKLISTYSGLIPLLAGIFISRHFTYRAFVVFLLIGLLTDLHVTLTDGLELSNLIMSVYSLVDILFLLWFTTRLYSIPRLYQVLAVALVFALWFWAYQMWEPWSAVYKEGSRYFEPAFLTATALIAAYGLIKIIESPKRSEWQGYFGFFIGIFIYNFCIFFNHTFVTEEIAKHFWYLNASFNILTMLIYTWAFVRLRKMQ
jgi:hypothetical protein